MKASEVKFMLYNEKKWIYEGPFFLHELCLETEYRPYVHVLLFTGVKDILGNELYEGDIVEFTNKHGIVKRKFIRFRNGMICLVKSNRSMNKEYNTINSQKAFYFKFKKIGNIYQNRNLLEQ